MSKSTGNFLTLSEAVGKFSADGVFLPFRTSIEKLYRFYHPQIGAVYISSHVNMSDI